MTTRTRRLAVTLLAACAMAACNSTHDGPGPAPDGTLLRAAVSPRTLSDGLIVGRNMHITIDVEADDIIMLELGDPAAPSLEWAGTVAHITTTADGPTPIRITNPTGSPATIRIGGKRITWIGLHGAEHDAGAAETEREAYRGRVSHYPIGAAPAPR